MTAWPSELTLANACGICERTVRDALRRLEKAHLLKAWLHNYGGKWAGNCYYPVLPSGLQQIRQILGKMTDLPLKRERKETSTCPEEIPGRLSAALFGPTLPRRFSPAARAIPLLAQFAGQTVDGQVPFEAALDLCRATREAVKAQCDDADIIILDVTAEFELRTRAYWMKTNAPRDCLDDITPIGEILRRVTA